MPLFFLPVWACGQERQPEVAVEKANPQAVSEPGQVRQAIERGLVTLDKQGLAWISEKQCSTCHHVPMMLWSFNEAKRSGFAINQKSLDEVIARAALVPRGDTVEHATHMALGLAASPAPDAAMAASLRKLGEHLVKVQEAKGSWESQSTDNPLGRTAVWTLWTTLALSSAHNAIATQSKDAKLPQDEAWAKSPEKGRQFVSESKVPAEPLLLVPQLLLEVQGGRAEEVQSLLKQLQAAQNADGGWAWKKDQPSDAFMTGQVLYGFSVAGVPTSNSSVQRACAYLVTTQGDDGSWLLVTTTKRGKPTEIFSYPATAWATIGLMRSLPQAVAPVKTSAPK